MKITSKILFLIFIYIQKLQQCTKGCLKCDATSELCLFCDYSNNYFLLNGKCEKKTIENCLEYSYDFKCIRCSNKYYPQDDKCIAFPGEIQNCEIYKNSTECLYCIQGYYYNGTECLQVSQEIMNCKYYSQNGVQCEQCEQDTFLYIDKQYCIYLDSFEGCGIWQQISCKSCIDGYYYNSNASLLEYFQNVNQAMIYNHMKAIIDKTQTNFIVKSCQKSLVENCEEFQNFNQCLRCKNGYILVNNICYESSNKNYQTCARYNDENNCIECKQGFYLLNNHCQSVDKILNCIKYNTKANTTLCQQCENQFYLDQNTNTCQQRKFSKDIKNCSQLKINLDRCEICQDEFQVTDDGLKCLPIIQNCKNYKPSTVYSVELNCKKCNDEMYYDPSQQICVQGTQVNCQVYKDYYDECLICKQGFYLNQNNQCIEHTLKNIFQCQKLSNSRDNFCEQCPENSIRITNRNFCRQIKVQITNCEIYQTEETCKKCIKGFRVSQDKKTCETIPIENCKVFLSDTECLKCFDYETEQYSVAYERSADKSQCLTPSLIQFENCNEIGYNQNKPFCQSCVQNFYPKHLPFNHRVCASTSFWKIQLQYDQAYLEKCEIFDYINQECIKCKDNKLLSQKQCVDACPVGEGFFLREIYKDFPKNVYKIRRQNYCDNTGTLPNCEIFDYSGKTSSNYYSGELFFGCVQCKTGFKAIVDVGNDTIHGQYSIHNKDINKIGMGNKYPFITKCVAEADVIANLLDLDASVDNCEYFLETTDLKYGCTGCSFGHSGLHFERNDYQLYYIKQCSVIQDCDVNSFYQGLFNPFNQPMLKYSFSKIPMSLYATCHLCSDPTKIVFYGISGGGVHNDNSQSVPLGYLSKFSLTTDPPYIGNDATQTLCAVPPPELNIPANCSTVQIIVDYQRKGYELVNGQYEALYDSGFVCVSCKPGFAPQYQSSGKIIACNEISNCSQTMFNGCVKCADGYVFGYSQLIEKVQYTQCLQNTTIQDCYAGVEIENVFYCRKCGKGFVLNLDGKCDPVSITNCSEQTFIESFALTNSNPRVQEPFEFLMFNNPSGCTVCDTGFVATTLEEDTSKQTCVQNRELQETGSLQSDNFVVNCLQNYYEPSTRKIRCKKCADNLLLVSGLCIEIQISEDILSQVGECQIFNYYTRRCDKCKIGYFLNAGVCYRGFIPNCEEFETISKCTKCETGFVVLTLNPEKAICFKIHENFNCNQWSLEASYQGELECSSCIEGYFADYNNYNIPPFLCFEINAVDNCAVHDIRYDIKVSTFNCIKCKPDFYLISNFCIPRILIDNCIEYFIDQDKCKQCDKGYSLNQVNNCVPSLHDELMSSPCELYYDQGKCLKCSPGHYIDKGINDCKEVLKSDKIANCLYYRSSSQCETCVNGYYLVDEACVKAIALNCSTYQSISKCKECPEGYGYVQNGEILSCQKIELDNCKSHNPDVFYPFECLICNQHFYLDQDKICQPVQKVIQYCEIYQDEFHCEQCEEQKALSESKDGCFSSDFILSRTDEFCYQSLLESVPKCQLCSFGYFFKNGQCQQCKIKTPQLGCMQCNPVNEFQCLICMPGFYQNVKGSCIKIFEEIGVDDEEEFTRIKRIIILVLFLLF